MSRTEVPEGERRRFDLGDSNLIFVNQREIAAAEAQVARVDAWADAQKAGVDLRWAQAALASPL